MKNLVLSVFTLLFASAFTFGQIESQEAIQDMTGGPIMTFDKTTVDYGTIEQHGEPLRFVEFTNTGDEPLIIKSAKGSCGCTVPIWPKEPIMPGETDKIEIRYDTKRLGSINKRVTITTNEDADPHVLKVVGKINAKEADEGVPSAKPSLIGGGK